MRKGERTSKEKGQQDYFSFPQENWLNHPPCGHGGCWWLFHFVVFGTEGFGMGLGEPEPAPHGVSICSSYNPVAPKGIPELWLMQGIDCMDLGKSWLTTRPFSPLPLPLAPAPLFRGRVDVRMASLMDCCGIKQKPFSGGPGVLPRVLGND